jgi:hypothetical protein
MAMRVARQQRIELLLGIYKGLPAPQFVRKRTPPFARQIVVPGFVIQFLVYYQFKEAIAEFLFLAHTCLHSLKYRTLHWVANEPILWILLSYVIDRVKQTLEQEDEKSDKIRTQTMFAGKHTGIMFTRKKGLRG